LSNPIHNRHAAVEKREVAGGALARGGGALGENCIHEMKEFDLQKVATMRQFC
jgi:hypothetical protein